MTGDMVTNPAIDIAVVSYNRLASLQRCLASIEEHTSLPYNIVICDDGSTDGSLEWLTERGYRVLGGANRGIAWNKNRGLYWLMQNSSAPVLVIIEDDCEAIDDWAPTWVEATLQFGHINLVHPSTSLALRNGDTPPEIVGGAGSATDPYACMRISGLCIASSRSALDQVGSLDSRFKGYGHEHAEWTTRFRRAGYGIRMVRIDGARVKANAMLAFGFCSTDVPSSSNKEMVKANKAIFDECKADVQLHRTPWRDAGERQTFLAEMPMADEDNTVVTRGTMRMSAKRARATILASDEDAEVVSVETIHDFDILAARVLGRNRIAVKDGFFDKLGFVSVHGTPDLDRNFDRFLDLFVSERPEQDADHVHPDAVLSNGSIRLLISTRREERQGIGFVGNVGDNYGFHVVRSLSGRGIDPYGLYLPPDTPALMTVGSFMQHAKNSRVVWGTGCQAPMLAKASPVATTSTYLGVRGPRSREQLLLRHGICPPVIGDPGLLVASTHPTAAIGDRHKVGICSHAVDVPFFSALYPDAYVITNDLPLDVFLPKLLSCETVISTSLHGLIMSDSFGIPCAIVKAGDRINGGEFKFIDYMNSLGDYDFAGRRDISAAGRIPDQDLAAMARRADRGRINALQGRLKSSFPKSLMYRSR